MLGYAKNPYDGDEWEDIIDKCYTLRYQLEGYQKIHANLGGDAGIEGYTKSGIVYQCYCPEKHYTDDKLWENQRDKVTKDIKKLINNGERLKELGVLKVKEWHFVTPEHRDKRILIHCENKRKEVLEKKHELGLDYIDDNFKILVKVGQDFMEEINKLVSLGMSKFDIRLKDTEPLNYNECDSEKIANIKRKLKVVINPDDNPNMNIKYDRMVEIMIKYYLEGIKIKNNVKQINTELYEKIISIDTMFKKDIEIKCIMTPLGTIHMDTYNQIIKDFESELKKEMGDLITMESIGDLKWNLMSAWLADCPMDFY